MEPIEISVAINAIEVSSRGDEPFFDNPNPYLWIFFFKRDRNGLFVRPIGWRSGAHKNVTAFDLVAPTARIIHGQLGKFTTPLWPLDPIGDDGGSVVGVFGALLEQDATQDMSIIEEYIGAFRDISTILAGWTPPTPLPERELTNAIKERHESAIRHTLWPLDKDDYIDGFFHTATYSDIVATRWGETTHTFDFRGSHGNWKLTTGMTVRPLVGLGNSAIFESRTGIDTPSARDRYLSNPLADPFRMPDPSLDLIRIVLDSLNLIETKAPTRAGPSGLRAGDLLTHFRDDSRITDAMPNGRWEPGLPLTWFPSDPRRRPLREAYRWPCWIQARPDFFHGIAVQGEEDGGNVCYFHGGWSMRNELSGTFPGVRDATGRYAFGILVPHQTPTPIPEAIDCRGAPALSRIVGPTSGNLIVLVPATRGGIDVYSSPDPSVNENPLQFIELGGFAPDFTRLRSPDGRSFILPTPLGYVYPNYVWPGGPPADPSRGHIEPNWAVGPHFGSNLGSNLVDAVRVVQSDYDAIEVLALERVAGSRKLVTYALDVLDPTQNRWSELATLPRSDTVMGIPGFIQSNYGREFPGGHGNFEVIAPGPGNQLLFWWCNSNLGRTWNGPFPISWDNFPYSIKAVHLIQLHRRGNQSSADDFLMILETGLVGMEPAPYGAGQLFWSRRNNNPAPGPWSFPEAITEWNRDDI